MDIAAEKKKIRAEMKAQRAALSHDEVREAAYVGAEALFHPRQLNLLARFRGFATYLSVGEEFPTDCILRELFRVGAFVGIPHFQQVARQYAWSAFAPTDSLISGHMGIPEPREPRLLNPAMIDVALVPGLAFDVCGGRIGYGGGVYDRLLPKLRATTLRIALAYDFQLLKEPLPQAEHDLQMDYIVTEKQWIDCRLARRMRRVRNG
jgi:5-formyltetrahydrofolate cyclo-ligase